MCVRYYMLEGRPTRCLFSSLLGRMDASACGMQSPTRKRHLWILGWIVFGPSPSDPPGAQETGEPQEDLEASSLLLAATQEHSY